jgi:hypothetical protein
MNIQCIYRGSENIRDILVIADLPFKEGEEHSDPTHVVKEPGLPNSPTQSLTPKGVGVAVPMGYLTNRGLKQSSILVLKQDATKSSFRVIVNPQVPLVKI